jgi:hypothetical protein
MQFGYNGKRWASLCTRKIGRGSARRFECDLAIKRAKLKLDAQQKHLTDIGLTLTREPRRTEAVEHILCKVSL